ncbi:MAG: TPM domain-containing protein [Steroidobacteraceae bacterium]
MIAGVHRTLLACAALLLLATGTLQAQELPAVPKLQGRATDLTGTLTAGQQAEIEEKLEAFEQRKGAQIALLVVDTVKPDSIEGYGIRVMDTWKLGRALPDDGALLLVALQDRELRIEVADGLEGALTDGIANRIIVETITPLFRQGDIYSGINAGLDQIIRVVDGEPLPEPDSRWQGGGATGGNLGNLLPFVLFGVFALAHVLRAALGRGVGAVVTAGATGGIVWVLSRFLPVALVAGVAALIYSLMATSLRGRGGTGGWRGGGFGNGGFGGWGGGGRGSGGGGFRGGGGHSSGGGASGRW